MQKQGGPLEFFNRLGTNPVVSNINKCARPTASSARNVPAVRPHAARARRRYIDACTCGRDSKAEMHAIRAELEKKDASIERLEEEIRRKDSEKDNLMQVRRRCACRELA